MSEAVHKPLMDLASSTGPLCCGCVGIKKLSLESLSGFLHNSCFQISSKLVLVVQTMSYWAFMMSTVQHTC